MIELEKHLVLEEVTVILGTPIMRLMENAGKGIASELEKRFDLNTKKIVFVCSHGNNGGDGFAAALYLKKYEPKVWFIGTLDKLGSESKYYYEQLSNQTFVDSAKGFDIIVDCMLGTGAKGELREPMLSTVKAINKSSAQVVSIDVPTGVDPRTGKKSDVYVKCDTLFSVLDLKSGLKEFQKKSVSLDIGFPKIELHKLDVTSLKGACKKRDPNSHKGDFGRVLVIGGSTDLSGAPILASLALSVLRSGADLVTLAAPEKVAQAAAILCPDIITKKLLGDIIEEKHIKDLKMLIDKADVILIGPGLGMDPKTVKAVRKILALGKVKVVDADAIKVADLNKVKHTIFTPHRREFDILLENSRIKPKELLSKLGTNVILRKGKTDFVFANSQKVYYNTTGNPAMTVGGTGDVLAGLVAGLLAQSGDYSNESMVKAASAGAFLMGTMGDELEKELGNGLIASDFLKVIAKMIKKLSY